MSLFRRRRACRYLSNVLEVLDFCNAGRSPAEIGRTGATYYMGVRDPHGRSGLPGRLTVQTAAGEVTVHPGDQITRDRSGRLDVVHGHGAVADPDTPWWEWPRPWWRRWFA